MRVEVAGSNVVNAADARRERPQLVRAAPEPASGCYLAPHRVAIETLGLHGEVPERFEITREQLAAFVAVILGGVPFDERHYLSVNSDIRESIARGASLSARTHFIEHGYAEGREPGPARVDEAWYLATYPDVAEGLELGEIGSCQEHFDGHGRAEGRLPFKI